MELNFIRVLLPLSGVSAFWANSLFNGKGAAFEGAVRQVCCTNTACVPESCIRLMNCPVPALFAKTISTDPDLLKKHQKPGLPFVLRSHEECDQLSLVLLGNAIAYLPLILKTLLNQTGSQALYPVIALDAQNTPVSITFDSDGNAENLPLLEASELMDSFCAVFHGCKSVRIDLETPLRMVRDGRELKRVDQVFFIRSLLRRLSSLAAYCGEGCDADYFRHLAALAVEVRLLRHTVVMGTAAHGRGIRGSYELQGPFEELGPLLRLGELVHLGKGASYGQGAFSVLPIS